jgi:methylated-DNA-[protein]-cysteine S-methyltransferase
MTTTTDDAAALRRLHERLVDAAARDDLLDVAYRTVDSPVGPLLLAATEAGLVRVAFANEGHDRVLDQLVSQVSPRVLRAPKRLDPVARELDEYFGRQRRAFDVALDLRLSHGFRREVLGALRSIDYGRTASYADVAAATGHPRAMRAVGSACRTNPLPIVVPCHRVIRSDGTEGHYAGGAAVKHALLSMESAVATGAGG